MKTADMKKGDLKAVRKEKSMTNPLKAADLACITPGARGEYDRAGRIRKGWAGLAMYSPRSTVDRPYTGANHDILRQAAFDHGFRSSYWGTWRAWMAAGCRPQGKPAGRVWVGDYYHHLWNFEQVTIEDMAQFESVAPAVGFEAMEQGQEQALEESKLTRADRQGYRWNCIKHGG